MFTKKCLMRSAICAPCKYLVLMSKNMHEIRTLVKYRHRKVLLAQSLIRHLDASLPLVHVVIQERAKWTNHAWETGFKYCKERRHCLYDFKIQRSSPTSMPSTSRVRQMGFARRPCSAHAFSIVWERCTERSSPQNASSDMILGFVRVVLPAVVLRSKLLIRSTQKMFYNCILWCFLTISALLLISLGSSSSEQM